MGGGGGGIGGGGGGEIGGGGGGERTPCASCPRGETGRCASRR